MKYQLMRLSFLLFLCVIAGACTKDIVDTTGGIFGKVTNAQTGEVIAGATVTLSPGGKSATTGSDGTFEFQKLDAQQYEIQVKKTKFETNTKRITVTSGQNASGDITLMPVAENTKIELSVSSLNFGKTNTSLSFDIKNIGNTKINWNISGTDKVEWLEISPVTGTLDPDKSNAVKVTLLRDKLEKNEETTILINADKESLALKVTAEVQTSSTKVELDTKTLNFGTEYTSLTFNVKNTGNAGNINWTISGIDVDWITVSPQSGTTAMNKSNAIKVDLDRSKFKGHVSTNILLNADGESLPVSITADEAEQRRLEVNPGLLAVGTSENASFSIISHNGATTYQVLVKDNASWLKPGKTTGTVPEYNASNPATIETINVMIDRTGLNAGNYNSTLIIRSDLEDIEIAVTMTVEAGSGGGSTTSGTVISCDANLEITLVSCKMSGSTATLSYKIKNISSSEYSFSIYSPYSNSSSSVYDDLGNEYQGYDVKVSVGASENYNVIGQKIPAGVAVKAAVIIKNVNDKASAFSAVSLYVTGEPRLDERLLIFKDVKIEGRTPQEIPDYGVSGSLQSCDSRLKMVLTDCKRSGTTVTIAYKITNQASREFSFGIYSPYSNNSSSVYDDQGTEYKGYDVLVGIGASENYNVTGQRIPAGVTVKASVKIKNVEASVKEFSAISLYAVGEPRLDENKVIFRNVKIK